MKLNNQRNIEDARITVNGVAPYPMRLDAVEAEVRGRSVNEYTAQAGGQMSNRLASALRHNDYKVALMRNLVRLALRGEPS